MEGREIAAFERQFRETVAPRPDLRSGVYVLFDGAEVVYVGASKDVRLRLATHRQRPQTASHLPKKKFDRALWMPLPEVVLPDYEGALIRAFLPKYNSRAPLDRGNDAEIMGGLGIAHLAGRDWRAHFERINRGRGDVRYGNKFGKRVRRG